MLASPQPPFTQLYCAYLVKEVNKFFHLFPECPDTDPYVGFFTAAPHSVGPHRLGRPTSKHIQNKIN
jgi:hypothetical protein